MTSRTRFRLVLHAGGGEAAPALELDPVPAAWLAQPCQVLLDHFAARRGARAASLQLLRADGALLPRTAPLEEVLRMQPPSAATSAAGVSDETCVRLTSCCSASSSSSRLGGVASEEAAPVAPKPPVRWGCCPGPALFEAW